MFSLFQTGHVFRQKDLKINLQSPPKFTVAAGFSVRSISHHISVNDGWHVKVPSSMLREGAKQRQPEVGGWESVHDIIRGAQRKAVLECV